MDQWLLFLRDTHEWGSWGELNPNFRRNKSSAAFFLWKKGNANNYSSVGECIMASFFFHPPNGMENGGEFKLGLISFS